MKKSATLHTPSTTEANLGPRASEGLRHATATGDIEAVRDFSAIVKTIRRTKERYDRQGKFLATTTKRIDLTLNAETWTQLEFLAERAGCPVVWEIQFAIQQKGQLKERIEDCRRADLERQRRDIDAQLETAAA